MELELDKESFLDDVRNIRSVRRNRNAEQTEGFLYLHDTITQSLFDGKGFTIDDIDFSKFTYDDLDEYSTFYNTQLSPKITVAGTLFKEFQKAAAIFVPEKNFY